MRGTRGEGDRAKAAEGEGSHQTEEGAMASGTQRNRTNMLYNCQLASVERGVVARDHNKRFVPDHRTTTAQSISARPRPSSRSFYLPAFGNGFDLLSVQAFIALAAVSPRVNTANAPHSSSASVSLSASAKNRARHLGRSRRGTARDALTLLLPRVELLSKLIRGPFRPRVRRRMLALVHDARQAGSEGGVERAEQRRVLGSAGARRASAGAHSQHSE